MPRKGLSVLEPKKASPAPFKLETAVALLGAEAQRLEVLHLRAHSWEAVGLGPEPISPFCVTLAQLLALMAMSPQI